MNQLTIFDVIDQLNVRKGFYRTKKITAVLIPGTDTIRRFQFDDRPGIWHFPLIVNGVNVEIHKFTLFEGEADA